MNFVQEVSKISYWTVAGELKVMETSNIRLVIGADDFYMLDTAYLKNGTVIRFTTQIDF